MSAAAEEWNRTTNGRGRVAESSEAEVARPVDRQYFLCVWALMIAGIVFVFSASFPQAGRPDALLLPGDAYRFVKEHSLYVALAFALMLVASRISPRRLRELMPWMVGIGLLLNGLVLFSPWGVELNGARRWLDLPGLPRFQPSEPMKIAFILLLAHVLAKKDERKLEGRVAGAWVLFIMGCVGVVLLMQRDQGMATIYASIMFALLFLSGVRLWSLAALVAGGLGLGLALAHSKPYRWRRIIAFLDPENAPPKDRYHILNMLIAQARGGVTGTGLGMSPDKWYSLPAAHTDSILSVIACEFGLIGAIVVLVAFAVLTARGLKLAFGSDSSFGFYAAAGASALICLQALAHIAVNTSCMPVTGLTLPFISGGGTSLVSAAAAAGIVLAVSRHQRSCEA